MLIRNMILRRRARSARLRPFVIARGRNVHRHHDDRQRHDDAEEQDEATLVKPPPPERGEHQRGGDQATPAKQRAQE
jgi:hypothetical protein